MARVKAEEQAERNAKQAEAERQARIEAEHKRDQAELVRLESEDMSARELSRHCPRCSRVFNSDRAYCLYDATPLLDGTQLRVIAPAKSPALNSRTLFGLVAVTFLGTVILGFGLISYLPNGSTTSALSADPPKPIETEVGDEPIVVGVTLNGKQMQLPNPDYPPLAKQRGISGKVTVVVQVNKSGTVTSARALDGHPLLQASAVAAARKTKFSPEKLSNQGGVTKGTITYNFKSQ